MKTLKPFAALPAQINSKLSELGNHEYWGDSFQSGEAEYALIEKDNGKLFLCITHGRWSDYKVPMGAPIEFFHTQTNRRTNGVVLCTVNVHNVERRIAKYGDKKIATWTLK